MLNRYPRTWKRCEYGVHFATFSTSENNFQALKYNLWGYKQWECLLLIKLFLNIAIIQLHSKQRIHYKFYKKSWPFCRRWLANANSAQTVLYSFLLMLYKASTCKIFWLCAVVFFHNFYSSKTIFFLFINLQVEHTLGKCYNEPGIHYKKET
jgi:hypothetical protein